MINVFSLISLKGEASSSCFRRFITGVEGIGDKVATGVRDNIGKFTTGDKFIAGVLDIVGKYSTGVLDTGDKSNTGVKTKGKISLRIYNPCR